MEPKLRGKLGDGGRVHPYVKLGFSPARQSAPGQENEFQEIQAVAVKNSLNEYHSTYVMSLKRNLDIISTLPLRKHRA